MTTAAVLVLLALAAAAASYTATSKTLRVTVFGNKDLENAFNALAYGAQKKVFRPALRAGGKVILAAVKSRVPVGTGNLKSAIRLKSLSRARRRMGVSIFVDKTNLKIPKTPGTKKPGFYPAHIELGYVTGGDVSETTSLVPDRRSRHGRMRSQTTRNRSGGTHVPPRSYMRAGFDAAKENALAAIETTARRKIGEIWANPPKNPKADAGGDGGE